MDETVLDQLECLFATVSRFSFRLDHTDWFGDAVLWLAPNDASPFRALTQRVFDAFPAFPPFEGQFDDVVPHLTIGHGRPLNDLHTAEESVRTHLPIDGHAAAVTPDDSANRRRAVDEDSDLHPGVIPTITSSRSVAGVLDMLA
jgi:2'-5' RNA ligase superfamily